MTVELSPCGEMVRKSDPVRFRYALFAAPEAREGLFALYAFNLELAKIAPMVSEPMIGEIRLQWWRDSLDMIFGGGPVRKHEVVEPLAAVVRGAELPRAPLEAMIDARAWDLSPEFPADESALEAYIRDTAGALTGLAAQALGAAGQGVGAAAERAGYAIGVARYLAAVPVLVGEGHAALPSDGIDWAGLRDGGTDAVFAQDVARLAHGGLTAVKRARAARGMIPRAAAPALLELAEARRVLDAMAKAEGLGGLVGAAPSPFRSNFSRLWRGVSGRW